MSLLFQSRTPRCIQLSCLLSLCLSMTVLQSFLAFHELGTCKDNGRVFCRMSLSLGTSDVFSWPDWCYGARRTKAQVKSCLIPSHLGVHDTNMTILILLVLRECLPGFVPWSYYFSYSLLHSLKMSTSLQSKGEKLSSTTRREDYSKNLWVLKPPQKLIKTL